jgi:LPXTG-motif cell wall-anchored protein
VKGNLLNHLVHHVKKKSITRRINMKKMFFLLMVLFLLGAASVQAAAVEVESATAEGESPEAESPIKAFDSDSSTKFLVFKAAPAFLQVKLKQNAIITSYSLTSANDEPGRDPKSWELLGSNDGENWEVIDKQSGQAFAERLEKKEYTISNNTKEFLHYKLNITENGGADIIQLADLDLSSGSANPKTGDAGVLVYIVMAALSAAVALVVLKRKTVTSR